MTKVNKRNNKVHIYNGKLDVGEVCCCGCGHSDCCSMLNINERFLNLLFDATSDCFPFTTTGILQGPSIWIGQTPFATDTITVWCESTTDPGRVILHCQYEMVISDSCGYFSAQQQEVSCYPIDATFTFETEEGATPPGNACCGTVTIRIYADDCNPVSFCSGCTIDSYCIGKELSVTLYSAAPCPSGDSSECCKLFETPISISNELDCIGDCLWETGLVDIFNDDVCEYKFRFEGSALPDNTQADLRYCDFILTIYDSGNAVVYSGRPISGLGEGPVFTFGPITLPCCTGEIYIDITE